MFNELEVLLLIFLRVGDQSGIEFLMEPTLLVLFPIVQSKMILPFIAKQPHELQEQLEQGQHEHALGVVLQMKRIYILNCVVEVMDVF